MTNLRSNKGINVFSNETKIIKEHAGQQCELNLTIAADQNGTLHLAANHDLNKSLQIKIDTSRGSLAMDSSTVGKKKKKKYGTTRTVALPTHKDLKLQVFLDHSLAEIFVNDGRHVLTLRYFADQSQQTIAFDHAINSTGTLYQLKNI